MCERVCVCACTYVGVYTLVLFLCLCVAHFRISTCVFIKLCSLHVRLLRRDPTIQVLTGGHSVY